MRRILGKLRNILRPGKIFIIPILWKFAYLWFFGQMNYIVWYICVTVNVINRLRIWWPKVLEIVYNSWVVYSRMHLLLGQCGKSLYFFDFSAHKMPCQCGRIGTYFTLTKRHWAMWVKWQSYEFDVCHFKICHLITRTFQRLVE